MVAAGVTLGPLQALAQSVPDAATNAPATDSIGPRELQNFSLNGTVTKSADTPAPAPSPATRSQAQQSANERATDARSSSPRVANGRPTAPAPASQPIGGQSLALNLPPPTTATPASAPQPEFAPEPDPAPASLSPEQKLPLWPWLLLAGVIGAGAASLLLRRRRRPEAFAGGPEIDAYVAPEPAPAPRSAPPPPPKATPPEAPPTKPAGVVSTRLRPWIEIAFAPLGCTVDDERLTLEFEVQLTNSGSAPARDIVVEASMFNAGATQEQDIGAFFAQPLGQGENIQAIPPLQHVNIRTSLVAPRQNIQVFELGGHQVFVPLVAFNAIYRLGSGKGQTSVAYLVGRETNGEKLGPLRADLGPRAFARLDARPLPINVRK
jgi:hypothetical protein